jgi:hypothetical protein
LNAPASEIAPPRLAGAAPTSSVFSPAQTSAEQTPAAIQPAVSVAGVDARPSSGSSAQHGSAPAIATRAAP